MSGTAENQIASTQRTLLIPLAIGLLATALHTAGFAGLLLSGNSPVSRAQVGIHYLNAGAGKSESIDALRPLARSVYGYDGQFELFIALSPRRAVSYVDDPAYRYERIVYPILSRLVAGGQPALIPWTLALINILASGLLTFLVALYLIRQQVSPWYALSLGLSPALATAVSGDLTEPLAYTLVAAGLVVFANRPNGAVILPGALWGFAGLTRESTLLFPLAIGAWMASGSRCLHGSSRRYRSSAVLLLISVLPLLVWKIVLKTMTDGASVPRTVRPEYIPFHGLVSHSTFREPGLGELLAIALPACLALVLVLTSRERVNAAVVALATNVIFLIVLLPRNSYESLQTSGRITLGVPLALLGCMPVVRAEARRRVALLPTALWMLGWVL